MPVSGFIVDLLATVAAAVMSLALTAFVLGNAARFSLVQAPNERSSHLRPTPIGGGLGILAGGSLAALPTAFLLPWPTLGVLAAGLLMGAVGLVDDRYGLGVRWRLLLQLVPVVIVVIALPLGELSAALGLAAVPLWLLGLLLALAGIAWINLYNFMDGIDGLAGAEAIFLLLAGTLISAPGTEDQVFFWWMIGLGAATAGFLVLNWPPARIFMGDVGSTYLGLMIGFFALATISGGWLTPWQWLILGAAFLADSLTTVASRALRGERIWEAHRRHAYQALQRRLGSHLRVTLIYLAVDVVVLLPLAWVAGALGPWGAALAIAVYVVLVPAALMAGAGRPLELPTRG